MPGHGGDVYWVTHEPGDVAVYCYTEFEYAQVVNDELSIKLREQSTPSCICGHPREDHFAGEGFCYTCRASYVAKNARIAFDKTAEINAGVHNKCKQFVPKPVST